MSTEARGAVLHFAADWLPASEVFVHDLVSHLARPSVVVSVTRPQNTERFAVPALKSLWPIDRYLHPKTLRPWATDRLLAHVARSHDAQVVHAHHGYRLGRLVPTLRRTGLPFVLSLHGHDMTGYLEERPHAYAALHNLVDAVVVPSRFAAGLAAAGGFAPELVRVMPSGVDTRFFSPTPLPEGDPLVLFVGRFVAKKGVDVLARAWPAVQAAVPAAGLRLLGFGPLETLARSIPGRVEVTLAPDRDQVRRAMAEATVVVSPSHVAPDDSVETLLMVNVEAQASGRPVVTTDHGGIPEYVRHGVTALVVPENDHEALAAAVIRVLDDTELARRMSTAGPAAVAELDVRRTARRMDDLYDELVRRRSSAPATT